MLGPGERASSAGSSLRPSLVLPWHAVPSPDPPSLPACLPAPAEGILAKYPNKMLAYNCSPSFNWEKNLTKDQVRFSVLLFVLFVGGRLGAPCAWQSCLTRAFNPPNGMGWAGSGLRPAGGAAGTAQQLGQLGKPPSRARAVSPHPAPPYTCARAQIATFQQELGKMGYKFQFVTLAGAWRGWQTGGEGSHGGALHRWLGACSS